MFKKALLSLIVLLTFYGIGLADNKESGIKLYRNGNDCVNIGEYGKAISYYNGAILLLPEFAEAYCNRGVSFINIEKYDKAIKDLGHAIKKDKFDKATTDFTKVIELKPDHACAYNGIAWIYAACKDPEYRNGTKALEFAKKSIALERDSHHLDTLAAAYAEVGNFKLAIKYAKEAFEAATDPEEKRSIQELIGAYESGKTYAGFKYGE